MRLQVWRTLWSWVPPRKLVGCSPLETLSAVYRIQVSSALFIILHYLLLTRPRQVRSTSSHSLSWRSDSIASCYQYQCLQSCLFSSCFSKKIVVWILFLSVCSVLRTHEIRVDFIILTAFGDVFSSCSALQLPIASHRISQYSTPHFRIAYSSPNFRDRDSHPYRTAEKIMFSFFCFYFGFL